MTNEKNDKRERTSRRWDFWTFIQNKLRSKKDTIYKEHRFKMLMWCKQNMKPMFVILLYIVIHIQIILPHLKYRLCLFIIPIFLSHGMGRSVDKDLRRPDHSFLWTRGRTLLGAYRLPDSGLVLDCNRSSGSICAGFYFILVWILNYPSGWGLKYHCYF